MALDPELAHSNKYVGRAIVHDKRGRLLLVQRLFSDTHERGCWEFPGGGYDLLRGDTSLAATALAELEEETGYTGELSPRYFGSLVLESRPLRPTPKDPHPTGDYWSEGHEIVIAGGTPLLQTSETQDLGWFFPRELPGLDYTESTLQGLAQMEHTAPYLPAILAASAKSPLLV